MTTKQNPLPKDAKDAAEEITVAAEYLMVALRALLSGRPVDDKEVQEPLRWAHIKLRGAWSPG